MSPLKHYQGPMLPGAEDVAQAMNAVPALPTEYYAEASEPAAAVDNPKESAPAAEEPEPQQYHISTYLTAFPDGTFGVTMQSDSVVAEGNGDHPEEAVLLAMHKLWTQLDRPRCPHCGQIMPEEAGK